MKHIILKPLENKCNEQNVPSDAIIIHNIIYRYRIYNADLWPNAGLSIYKINDLQSFLRLLHFPKIN